MSHKAHVGVPFFTLALFLKSKLEFKKICNRTRNEHFAYLKQAAKSNFVAVAFNDGR
jgi:hypothetical protein